MINVLKRHISVIKYLFTELYILLFLPLFLALKPIQQRKNSQLQFLFENRAIHNIVRFETEIVSWREKSFYIMKPQGCFNH